MLAGHQAKGSRWVYKGGGSKGKKLGLVGLGVNPNPMILGITERVDTCIAPSLLDLGCEYGISLEYIRDRL